MLPTIRAKSVFWASLLCLSSCLGCATSSLVPSQFAGLSKTSAEESDLPKNVPGELPPKEAARACLVAAEELQNNGHTQQAILLYEKARNYDPSLKSVSHHLAVLYDAQGDSARSLAEYNKALESDPKNRQSTERLRILLLRAGKLRRSRTVRSARPWRLIRTIRRPLCNLGAGSCRTGTIRREFRGLLQSGWPRRGPFQRWRAHGQTRTLRPGKAGIPSSPCVRPHSATAQGILGISRQAAACSLTTDFPSVGDSVSAKHSALVV